MDVGFDGPEVVVFVRGEVDLLTAPTMGAVLGALVGQGHQHITVDLSRLAFMDAAGLAVIVDIAGRLTRSAGALVLRSTPALTRRIIQIAGVADRVMLTPSAAQPTSAVQLTNAVHGSIADEPDDGHGDSAARPAADSNRDALHSDLARVRSRRADTEVLDAALRLVAVL
ncbi:MAG TPA: STAS domain-containing protein, partial [Euzebya sp.]|nr:STAS domain-containing protein [Euzebya sp.]